jgi:hypothetical protein
MMIMMMMKMKMVVTEALNATTIFQMAAFGSVS